MASKSKVYFFFDQVTISLPDRARLKKAIEQLFIKEKKNLSGLNYIFCDDKTLLLINQQYLKHSDYTDIITFDLSETKSQIVGEIYISVDRIRENAQILKTPVRLELIRVIFHGALHLCGYKDKTKREKEKMREKEDFFIAEF